MKISLKLKNHEAMLLLFIVGTCLYLFYFKDKFKSYNTYYLTLQDTKNVLVKRLFEIEKETPNVRKKAQEVANIKLAILKEEKRFKKLGAQIPSMNELHRFLYYITQENHTQGIEFLSIRPVLKIGGTIQKDQRDEKDQGKDEEIQKLISGYKVFEYTLKLRGGFQDITNYFHYLEDLSQFVRILDVLIKQDTEEKSNLLEASLRFSILISEDNKHGKTSSFYTSSYPNIKKIRSPFVVLPSKKAEIPKETKNVKLPIFEISGVLKSNETYRIIVDKIIYRVGDQIDKTTIISITIDKVLLETSGQTHEILL